MASNRDSLITNRDLLNKLWIIFGGVLGVISSLSIVTQQTQNVFPQLGIYEKILNIVVVGAFGIGITRQCKPAKKALVGGTVFPIILLSAVFLTSGSEPISPAIVIGWISSGTLAGILVGTAWFGALIGALTMAFVILVIAPTICGAMERSWIFMPMGSAGGSLVQLVFKKTAGKPLREVKNKNEVNEAVEWLQQKNRERKMRKTIINTWFGFSYLHITKHIMNSWMTKRGNTYDNRNRIGNLYILRKATNAG